MTAGDLDDTFLPLSVVENRKFSHQSGTPVCPEGTLIQVAGVESRSLVAGPGIRAVVWVSGCHRRCPGCSQPEYLSFGAGREVSVANLWSEIQASGRIDGLTFSGGEPFEQAASLAVLARLARSAGLSIVCYTGYRYEALRTEPLRFGTLLEEVDLLIDGEFRSELAGRFKWRGSSNQRLLRLTDRIELPEEESVSEMQIGFSVGQPRFAISGIWPPGVAGVLMRELFKAGFEMEYEETPPDCWGQAGATG
jgi:anaerobic ribonucleoside-triphosphate reductase activating protein